MGNKVRIFQVLGDTRYLDVKYKYQNFESVDGKSKGGSKR